MQRKAIIDLGTTVSSGTSATNPATVERLSPRDGTIENVIVSFPDGTGGNVGAAVERKSGQRLFPHSGEDGFLFGDGANPPPIALDARVSEGETLVGKFTNTDGANHHVMVVAVVRLG